MFTFMEDHLRFHARNLARGGDQVRLLLMAESCQIDFLCYDLVSIVVTLRQKYVH